MIKFKYTFFHSHIRESEHRGAGRGRLEEALRRPRGLPAAGLPLRPPGARPGGLRAAAEGDPEIRSHGEAPE